MSVGFVSGVFVGLFSKARVSLEVFAINPCDKQCFCNRVLDCFPVNKFVQKMTEISDDHLYFRQGIENF